MSAARLALLLAAACSFGPGNLTLPDGAREADGPPIGVDAPPDGRADALVLPPFGTAVAKIDTGYTDDDPSLTADQLEIFFGSYFSAGTDEDIWWAQRTSVDQDFQTATRIDALSLADANETTIKLSGADGLTIAFTRVDPTAHLFIATRPGRGSDAWTAPLALSELDTPAGEWSPFLLPDGVTLIYCSRVDDVLGEEIFVATRANPGVPFGAPTRLASLSSEHDDCDAMMPTPDVIYFSRVYVGTSDSDIFVAERTTGWEFAPARRLEELVSAAHDRDPWVSADQRTVWFSSNRTGAYDLYLATR